MIFARADDYNGDGTFRETFLVMDGILDDAALAMCDTDFVDGELRLCGDCPRGTCEKISEANPRMRKGNVAALRDFCKPLLFDYLRKTNHLELLKCLGGIWEKRA